MTSFVGSAEQMDTVHRRLGEIWLRDPYVVVLRDEGKYLLFGTTDEPPEGESAYSKYPATGFQVYESATLNGPWKGPRFAFERAEGFWSRTQYWAPEVVKFGAFWYLTATFGGNRKGRSCQIMRSTDPRGPFEAFTAPVTPLGWFCLDGHLYFGEANPLIVFCREWIEVGDGEMYYAPLSADLTCLAGDPIRLFSASEAPWTNPIDGEGVKYVTDGPFLWKSRATGELLMLWSSIGANGNYCVGVSRSKSGLVNGPWEHDAEPIFSHDGGHCMLFRPLAGQACEPLWDGKGVPPLLIALHQPNKDPLQSRATFFLVEEAVTSQSKLDLSVNLSKRIS